MRKTGVIVTLLTFTILFLLPLILVLSNSSIESIREIVSSKYYGSIILFTLRQALVSTLFSLIVGLPGAWILAKYKFKLKNLIKTVYFIPYVLPSILVVLGFVIFYGNTGMLNTILGTNFKILYSFKAVILAHVFFNFPIIATVVSNKWIKLDSRMEDEAQICGANQFVIFKRITLPRLIPAIASACILVFLFCFTSFAIILVLGGGPKLSTIEVEIYKLSRINLDFAKAGSLSILSLFIASMTLLLYNLANSKNYSENNEYYRLEELSKASFITRSLVFLYLAVTALFIILPISGIIIRSFSPGSFSKTQFSAVINTVIIGIGSSFLTTAGSVLICSELSKRRSNITETVLMLPMATSSIIVGLGYFIIGRYTKNLPDMLLVILCHAVINCPFAIKTILPVYRSIPREQIEAAMVSGADDSQVFFKIEIPYVRETAFSAMMFTFALSCGELNATLMITKSDLLTIPVQIQRLIAAYDYSGACALGTVLIVLSTLLFLLFQSRHEEP